ncbi:hypothetical protein Tco_1394485 [Tanacetum coccineum]
MSDVADYGGSLVWETLECGITVPLVYSFGDIPTIIPSTSVVAPETSTIAPVNSSTAPVVETTLVASPTGLCSLVPYSGSYSDSPDEIVWTLPARRLASRHASPRSSDHHSSSSRLSLDSSPVYSVGLDASDQAHSGPSTRDSHHQEIHQRDPCIHLHILLDHLTRHEIPLILYHIYASYGIISSYPLLISTDLVRVQDSYSSEASIEEDTEIDPIETRIDIELGIGDGDDVRDHVEILKFS